MVTGFITRLCLKVVLFMVSITFMVDITFMADTEVIADFDLKHAG